MVAVTPSAASVFRTIDKFQPTLFLDEFNSDANSDDAAALIQILNAGASRLGSKVMKAVKIADGEFGTKLFDCYGPKIIGSLKASASTAFNSRCIPIPMERTTRNDIPLRVTPQMLRDAQAIRNKLTLYRLRNYHIDLEARFDVAEKELKTENVLPRSIQLNTALFALIDDKDIKEQFTNLLRNRDDVLREEKENTLDGQIVQAIHTILFTIDEPRAGHVEVTLSISLPIDGEICEHLRLEKLLSMVNSDRPNKNEISSQWFGKQISGLGLRTKKILRRNSDHRTQKAIVFDLERLSLLFRLHGQPVSDEFNVTNVTKTTNCNNDNSLQVVTNNSSGDIINNQCYQPNPSKDTTYKNGNIGNIKNAESTGKEEIIHVKEVF